MNQPASHLQVVRDHHDVVVEQVAYTVEEVATLIGRGYQVALRLVRTGRIRSRNVGNGRNGRYLVPGAAIIEFLDGSDEPLHQQESA